MPDVSLSSPLPPPDDILQSVWKWRPAPPDGGRDYGNSNIFATPPDLDTLVRETGQNSLDAILPGSPKVTIRYKLIELEKSSEEYRRFASAVRLDDLLENVDAASKTESKIGRRLARGHEELLESDRIVLLRIDDYGTTGLFGSETPSGGDVNPFAALVRNNLDSSKASASAGGSFGLGKAVNWRCSKISTVLMASRVAPAKLHDGARRGLRVIGKAELTWHQKDEGAFAGPGWYSKRETTSESLYLTTAAAGSLQLDRSDRPEGVEERHASGTSVLIVGFEDPSSQGGMDVERSFSEFGRAAATHFWPAIESGSLDVVVEHWKNGSEVEREIVSPRRYVPELCDAYEKYLSGSTVEELTVPGDVQKIDVPLTIMDTKSNVREIDPVDSKIDSPCHLLVRLAEKSADSANGPHAEHVALVRGRSMVVKYWAQRNIMVGGRPFHALLLAGTAAGDSRAHVHAEQFLRAAEPPAHDDWTYNPEMANMYKPGTGARLKEFFGKITEELRKAIRPREGSEQKGPAELRRLLGGRSEGPPGSNAPATLRYTRAEVVDGRWQVSGQVHIRDRRKSWSVAPRLRLEVERGSPIELGWDSLTVIEGGDLLEDRDDWFTVEIPGNKAKFEGISVSSTLGIPATSSRLRIDLLVEEVESA